MFFSSSCRKKVKGVLIEHNSIKFQKSISGLSRMCITHVQEVGFHSQYLCFSKSIDNRTQPEFGWQSEHNASWEF